jgi:putative Mg2+ transporter-C (MgtC) family protein
MEQFIRIAVRLTVAVLLGAAVGVEREARGRAAGLRTHMLVALGAALFTVVPVEAARGSANLGEIIKGVAAGVGFLGGGAILRMTANGEREVKGLTTAAGIWLTAAVGVATGAGWIWVAGLAILISLIILTVMLKIEGWINRRRH